MSDVTAIETSEQSDEPVEHALGNMPEENDHQEPERRFDRSQRETLYSFFEEFRGTPEVKVSLLRIEPKKFKGVRCGGTLDTFQSLDITEEEILEQHGGGKFQIRVQRKDMRGRWKFAGLTTFEIAGDPIVEHLRRDQDRVEPTESESLSTRALEMTQAMAEQYRKDAESARAAGNRSGYDVEMIKAFTDPLMQQITALEKSNAELAQRLYEQATKPADTQREDRLLDLMGDKEQTHGNQIMAIRTQHDSELRSMRENHREEIRALRDQHREDLKYVRQNIDREVASLKEAHNHALESQKQGFENRIDALKDINKRLDRELSEARTELVALRAKKEISPIQQIQGMVELKNAMEAIAPSGDEPKSTFDKLAEAAAPMIEGLATRVSGAGEGHAGAAGGDDPLVEVRMSDGTTTTMPRSQAIALQQQAQAQAAAQAAARPIPELDDATITRAATYMAQAYANNIPPEVFANSARSQIPKAILEYVQRQGVDEFLDNVAKLEGSSPLATAGGRDYVRKVAHYLLRGSTHSVEEPSSP